MVYKIQIQPFAALETVEAYDWYELQQEGIGQRLLSDLDDFYASLLQNPHKPSYYEKPIRQVLLNNFPYQVVYEILDNNIVVYSVFMARQNPIKKKIFLAESSLDEYMKKFVGY